MNDLWTNWDEAQTTFEVNGSLILVRVFIDEFGNAFTITSITNIENNMSKVISYRNWGDDWVHRSVKEAK